MNQIEFRAEDLHEFLNSAKETIMDQLAEQNMEFQESVILSEERHRAYQNHMNVLTAKAFEAAVECNQTENAFADNSNELAQYRKQTQAISDKTQSLSENAADVFAKINLGIGIIHEQLNQQSVENFNVSEVQKTRQERLDLVRQKIDEFSTMSATFKANFVPISFR